MRAVGFRMPWIDDVGGMDGWDLASLFFLFFFFANITCLPLCMNNFTLTPSVSVIYVRFFSEMGAI